MYEYVDRPIQKLDYPSHFLVWSMRQWVFVNIHKRCPCSTLEPAFTKWTMIEALPDFSIAMAHLNESAQQQLVFGQPNCGTVHEIEAILLAVRREIFAGNISNARGIAEKLVIGEAVASFTIALQRYCDHVAGSPLSLAHLPINTEPHHVSKKS
ncbi:hypothetical protein [Parasphingorhabdus cellanae]|uniref:Uncharacterized protein n=1 Tax=Parasphingorhabdus cellanae TaxID=2806553 RepID=A0ABX7T117_9SPHN|nr:hypothetical protein [Parasphingorhabdus cellanae]QTD54457.1 hypothetical protein J4G78_09105 [Parasphingorhabdus cellanae]